MDSYQEDPAISQQAMSNQFGRALKNHHFRPEDLSELKWSPRYDLDITYEKPSDSRIDRLTPGSRSLLHGYHEATFPIGADEVGYVLIPDSALRLLQEITISSHEQTA
jgi:hypothetical protein